MKGLKKIVIFNLLLICTLSLYSQKQDKTRTLTNSEKILGLSRLWEGVKNNYVYYDQLNFSWDSLYAVSIPKILDIKDTYSYIRELEKIIAAVKDGHTFIIPNIHIDIEERTPAPFNTKLINGKVLVDQSWSPELTHKGVVRGVEVTAINGLDVIKYGEKVIGQYIPSSTPQWLEHEVFDNFNLTRGEVTTPINIEFYDGQKKFKIEFDRRKTLEIKPTDKSGLNVNPTLKYTTIGNNIGYLTVGDFMNRSFNQLFDSIYTSILHSNALIIDLRNNEGGNSNYADYILTHLSSRPIKTSSWSSRMYIPAHASWHYPEEWYLSASDYLTPQIKEIYNKPITVLINSGTFSSSEDFCVKFRGMKRGKLIGTPTGGSTGNGVQITLIENVVSAKICSKKDIAPDGTAFVGVGVIPDIVVKDTEQSFINKKDIVLEMAISDMLKN
jgi:C-terminal processing protease CtpA/Prc